MDDALVKEFVSESREHLSDIEADLLTIESGGANIDEDLVNKVFRAAHSIKGGSGFFGFVKIKELAHKAETVLDMLRTRKMTPNAEVINLLLAAFDRLRDLINSTRTSDQADIADLVTGLVELASAARSPQSKALLDKHVVLNAEGNAGTLRLLREDVERAVAGGKFIYWVDYDLIHDIEKKGIKVLALFNELAATCEILECEVDFAAAGTLEGPVGNRIPLRMVVATTIKPDKIDRLFETVERERIHLLLPPEKAELRPQSPKAAPVESKAPEIPPGPEAGTGAKEPKTAEASVSLPVADETLRVNVDILDTLMNLASELVLSRNQLRAAVTGNQRQLLFAADQRINQVTSELQDAIMQTRLQTIGNVFSKFPRVVRDLSKSLGKEIKLDIRGKDVALDKTLIEGLSDPLTHMVRNAVDHGVETVEERLRAGKNPAGNVVIEARHEAGQVVVEIIDDGKGIDPDKVAAAAVAKGFITAEKVQGLTDRDKQALIFLPGLSTAKIVSDVSGRGVGMDVVKTNLDRLGGQIEILSESGKGSTFRIKLPLTLAIIPSLIISLDNKRFAIPQANIEELIRLRPDQVKDRIEFVGDREVLLLRDRVLPLVRFADVVGTVPTYTDSATGRKEIDRRVLIADRRSARHAIEEEQGNSLAKAGTDDGSVNRRGVDRRKAAASALEIVVVKTGALSYGMVVGSFLDTEEVVVKPLGSRFKRLREYSGATILGDGTVALILDTAGLAVKAGIISVSGSTRAATLAEEAEAKRLKDLQALLIFHNGPDEACAVPLDLIERIEKIKPAQVERLGGLRSMQYLGVSIPLIALADAAQVVKLDDEQELVVLVSNIAGRQLGLLASPPLDVVEAQAIVDQTTHRQSGIAGSIIVRGRTTLLVDIHELSRKVHPEWGVALVDTGKENITVLLAEDSDFFRSQVQKFLEEEGFSVLSAPDGEAAWELLLGNLEKVKIIVTDIEMPRLTGLGLASRIRGDSRTASFPIIAVTSLAGDEDAARGQEAGITEYHVKLDRDSLLSSVRKLTT